MDCGVLINNAGVSYDRSDFYHDLPSEKLDCLLNVNCSALMMITQAFMKKRFEEKKGKICENLKIVKIWEKFKIIKFLRSHHKYIIILWPRSSTVLLALWRHQGLCSTPIKINAIRVQERTKFYSFFKPMSTYG